MDRADLDAVFAGDEPLEQPDNEERFRSAAGSRRRRQALRVRRGRRRVPGRHGARGPTRPDRAGTELPARLRAELAAGRSRRPRRRCSSRRAPTTFRIAMRQPISWSALADASVGVWGLGVEGQASVRRLPRHGTRSRCSSTTAPAAPTLDGLEVLATGTGRTRRAARLRRRGQEPGHQPLPARGGAARGRGRAGLRRARPLHGRGRSDPSRLHHRHEGQEHHDRAGGAPARRPGRTTPGPAGTSATRPGTPPRIPHPTTGSSRPRASRCPTWTTGPRGRRHLPVTRPSRLARDGRALLRRQALAVHQTRGDAGPGRRHRRRAPAPGRPPRAARPVGDASRGRAGHPPGRRPLGLAGPTTHATPPIARAVLDGLGIPGADNEQLAAAARASPGCPSRCRSSAGSARSSSSTTACRPTCCRRRPPRRPSTTAPSRCSSAGTTGARLHAAGPDHRGADRADARRHHARQRTAHRAGRAGRQRRARRGDRRRRPGRRGRRGLRVGPGGRRRPALAGGAELRALRRLSGAVGRLRRGGGRYGTLS